MAELLSYDNGPDTVSTAENLTEDEQDSLEVGSKLVEEQEALLAGKYKNAEDLEKAYIELQQKLGSKSDESEETPEVKDEKEEEVEESDDSDDLKVSKEKDDKLANDDYSLLEKLWEEAQTEYTDDTTNKLSELSNEELVNMHLSYRQNVENNYIPQRELSKEDVEELQEVAGGPQEYKNMISWAKDNLDENEASMFDQVMQRGDPLSCFFAVQALQYRYEDDAGTTGETMVTGTAPKESKNIFRSQAEIVAAMSDPRYEKDPAYRNDIMKKLENSPNVQF
jgi:hypothetical protein